MAGLELLIFIGFGLLLGSLIVSWLDPFGKLTWAEVTVLSQVVGFFTFVFLILAASIVFRDLRLGIFVSYGIVSVLGAIFWRQLFYFFKDLVGKIKLKLSRHHIFLGIFFVAYVGILLQVMIWDSQGFPLSVLVGWGDGAYHLDIIRRLATAEPFGLEQPIATGQPLTYPLFLDFMSAVLLKIGAKINVAWHLPVFLFGSGLFLLLWFLGQRIFNSKLLAATLVFLVFFGAGLGFLWFFDDLAGAGRTSGWQGIKQVLLDPPHEYTHLDSRTGGKPSSAEAPLNIVWMVPAVSFFSHQRSFTVGAAISLMILLGFWLFRQNPLIFGRWLLFLGLLPLAHSHSFLAMSLLVALLFIQEFFSTRKKQTINLLKGWFLGGLGAVLFSLPQVVFLSRAGFLGEGRGSSFFRLWFGWMTCSHSKSWYQCDPGVVGTDTNPFWFWSKNFGVIFLVWVMALIFFSLAKRKTNIHSFILASIFLFAVPNLILFQPWEFDNNKALFYWWLLAIIISLAFFSELWRTRYRWLVLVFFIIFLISSGLSGSIDVWARLKRFADFNCKFQSFRFYCTNARQDTHFGYYSKAELEVAEWIRQNTEPNDGFLTTDSANQFIPMTTGRSIYLGFPGWLWTQGRGDVIALRKETVRNFLLTGDAAMLCQDGVRYWLLEPAFFVNYPVESGQAIIKNKDAVFYQIAGGVTRQIIKLPCPTT